MGVSIPFIAGQWSLPAAAAAVVAAWRGFNPLHCGAVVASGPTPRSCAGGWKVSIPFIAGQWSLLPARWRSGRAADRFQSPSLRGSGRFELGVPGADVAVITFQSPSLRGSGRFHPAARRGGKERKNGFNPLHCGAVVASRVSSSPRCSAPFRRFRFQSPSLRGSGRFGQGERKWTCSSSRFNPLHCGAVVASSPAPLPAPLPAMVSIPFIAGQWSLRTGYRSGWRPIAARFNPLHCGAVVASAPGAGASGDPRDVSIPFIAGQWSLP